MLCSLDDFQFESDGVNLETIKTQSQYDYVSTKTLDDFEHWQATGKYSTSKTLAGKLIKKSNASLNDLELIAARKKPVTLAFEDGQALTVVIMEINTDRAHFIKTGAFLVQDFEVLLGVVYGQFTDN